MFGCIPKNSLKNILQCLEQCKMKKKKKKFQKPIAKCNPTTAIHHKSTANHHKKTHKPTITVKATQSKPRTIQNKQIITIMSNTGSWRTSTSERSKQTDISKVALADSGGGKGLLCEGDDDNCYGSSPHSSSPRTSTLNPTFRSSVPLSPSTHSDPSSSPTAPPSTMSSPTLSTESGSGAVEREN